MKQIRRADKMVITRIGSTDEKELDIYARLREPELLRYYEPEPGIFIAESPKVIKLALAAGYEPISFLAESHYLERELKEITGGAGISDDVKVYTGETSVLLNITGFRLTRGMLCAMRRRPDTDPVSICQGAERIAVLENIVNPTNIGAIMRSAAAMNMDAILLTEDCSDPLYRRAVRVSMGTVFQIPWAYVKGDMLSFLKDQGFSTAAMAIDDSAEDLDKISLDPGEKLAVLLGTEGDGLKSTTIAGCDHIVKIPMRPGVDSLNVAAASAVAFYELGRRQGR